MAIEYNSFIEELESMIHEAEGREAATVYEEGLRDGIIYGLMMVQNKLIREQGESFPFSDRKTAYC